MANKHRGRNEGSIFQRPNKKWRAQIYYRGQRISKNTETKAEALEWAGRCKLNWTSDMPFKGSTTTLNDYLPSWLKKSQAFFETQNSAPIWRNYQKAHPA